MPILESSEVLEAYTVFQNASGLGWPRARILFFKVASIKRPTFDGVLKYSLTDAEAKRIEMLNGPHGYTYAKALIAQVTDENLRWSHRHDREAMFMAFHRWEKVFEIEGGRSAENLIKFAEFTGDPFDEAKRNTFVNIDNPEVMEKVDLINGPNGYTLLKMWKAQQ